MVLNLLTKVFGSQNERELKRLQPIVDQINALEPAIQALNDEELKAQTSVFRQRIAQGETLDDILPEAFATVRENRRGQDPGRNPACLPQRVIRQGRSHRYG